MSKDHRIEERDEVMVNFNGSGATLCARARVEGVPVATGDSWIFLDLDTRKVHYVSEGCTVTLLAKSTEHFEEVARGEDTP